MKKIVLAATIAPILLVIIVIIHYSCYLQILDKEALDKVRADREIPDIKPGYIIQLKVVGTHRPLSNFVVVIAIKVMCHACFYFTLSKSSMKFWKHIKVLYKNFNHFI